MNGKGNIALWAWDNTNKVPVRLQADENGFVKVDMSDINLDDLGDVKVPTPSDGDGIYFDDAAGEWKVRAFLPLAGGAMLGDFDIGAHNILTTDLLIRQLTSTKMTLRNRADTSYRNWYFNKAFLAEGIELTGNAIIIDVDDNNDYYVMLRAMINDGAFVEIARLQNAASPYFQASLPMVLKPSTQPGTLVEGHIWYDAAANKIKYNDAIGVKTIGREFQWKDAPVQALDLDDLTSNVDWTDLDLTSVTAPDAKLVLLQLELLLKEDATADVHFGVRKNGTSPTYYPRIALYNQEYLAWHARHEVALVGMDAGQVIEYYLVVGSGKVDAAINVLGYV